MAGCCNTKSYERMFGAKQARVAARRYRARGVRGTARDLVELAGDVSGASVLEVGGGVGAINLVMRLSGSEFRAFVHPVARISAAAGEHGLALGERRRGGVLWESAAYERLV